MSIPTLSPTNQYTLEQMLPLAYQWKKTPAGYIIEVDHGKDSLEHLVTLEELTSYDQRLPPVLQAMFAKTRKSKAPDTITGPLIVATLALWKQHMRIRFKGYDYALININGLTNDNGNVTVKAAAFDLRILSGKRHGLSEPILYAARFSGRSVVLSAAYLEQKCPGWESRYMLATELGVSPAEAARHALLPVAPLMHNKKHRANSGPLESTGLPDISYT